MTSAMSQPPNGPFERLLLVEPDADRVSRVERALRGWSVDLQVVSGAAEAIRSLMDQIPALVLTSPLLPPADEAALRTQLTRMAGTSHVQIINLPYVIEEPPRVEARRGVLDFLRRPGEVNKYGCEAGALREQIEEYLRRAVAVRAQTHKDASDLPQPDHGAPGLVEPITALVPDPAKHGVVGRDRRRASRFAATDLQGMWVIRLPWGTDAKLVDISNSGVLFESPSKISPGVSVDLQILGDQKNMLVPARMVRSDVSRTDAFGITYRIAAAFARELRLMDFDAVVGLSSPRVVTDLLARVLGDVDRPSTTADVSMRLETELRRLLPKRMIQIRTAPSAAIEGSESIYFTAGPNRILQVTFEAGTPPSAMEFRLLRTAANLAAAAFETLQMSDGGSGQHCLAY